MNTDPGPMITENQEEGRFELRREGELVSIATYRDQGGTVVMPHVETSTAHRGKGYAAELMDGVMAILRESSRTIVPLCPFAADHIRDNEHYHDLLAP